MAVSKELDYLNVLKALHEIPFGVGKNLLVDFLQGNQKNESVARNKLHLKNSFGSMAYDKDELSALIDNLALNGLIDSIPVQGNKFWKVLSLSTKGRSELVEPSLYKRKMAFGFKDTRTKITEQDRQVFSHFDEFLGQFNDEQKKAILSPCSHILCIAGAGSGKTAVLTKRVEFLIRYRSMDPARVLAITFTRKARQEMTHRLTKNGYANISVETFNSFCEKILQKHYDVAYGKPVRVLSYRDKFSLIARALGTLQMTSRMAISAYFTGPQQNGKTEEQLTNIFMNDCFFIRDYFKAKNKPIELASFAVDHTNERSAKLIFAVCCFLDKTMLDEGLRDFADQLLDAIKVFQQHPELVPKFEHLLIDEYQDVNSTQIKLVDILAPTNLFCVGDPRQSIYGWRGSDVRHMLNFEEKYPGTEVITLTKNYRSTQHIVNLINDSIRAMGLADLECTIDGKKDTRILKFDSEQAEFEFVIHAILSSNVPPNEIFVLARTNRQLSELSMLMHARNIKHILRSDEIRTNALGEGDITLATIHAIKGLEAQLVFIIGCTSLNFPAKGSEHPVIEMVKVEEYDKEEEEKRLFYVAMSRAKKSLYLTHSSKLTAFMTPKMLELLGGKHAAGAQLSLGSTASKIPAGPDNSHVVGQSNYVATSTVKHQKAAGDVIERLKTWRRELARQQGMPPYFILHDKTIIDLAQQMPITKNDLANISGLGPVKIARYGSEILKIVVGE